jgi:protein phosphatase 2C family protein 2/3
MSNQEVVDFVQQQICQGKELATVCEELLDFCLAPDSYLGAVGCDNMSVIIVGFLNGGRTREQWLEQCRRTVNPNPVVSTHIRSAGSGGGVDAADDDVASQMVRLAAATSITTTAATVREDVNGGSGKLQLTSTTATTTTTTTTASATIIKDSKLQK